MPHVRDGELHAWLDGALDRLGAAEAARVREHISTCADCRARVEQEADLREQASALLDGALGREVVPPPFEELLRRAAAMPESPSEVAEAGSAEPRSHRAGGFGSGQRWAWAASVVLALGTGWLMGGGSLDFRDINEGVASSPQGSPADGDLAPGFAEAESPAEDAARPPAPSSEATAEFSDLGRSDPEGVVSRGRSVVDAQSAVVEEAAPPVRERREVQAAEPRPTPEPDAAAMRAAPTEVDSRQAAAEAAKRRRDQFEADSLVRVATRQIEGVVVDEATGAPLVGAQVSVVGTTAGGLTNEQGRFAIRGDFDSAATVEAALVGYTTEMATAADTEGPLRLSLEQSAIALDEIVVTGTGAAAERRTLGNSVSQVEALDDEIGNVQAFRYLRATDGRAALLPSWPIVAALPSQGGDAGAVVQSLGGADSVMVIWFGDSEVGGAVSSLRATLDGFAARG